MPPSQPSDEADRRDDRREDRGETDWCGSCVDAVDTADCGCDGLCCAFEGLSACDAPCVTLLTGLWTVLGYAVRHRPRDPYSDAPHSLGARLVWVVVRAYQLTVSAARP